MITQRWLAGAVMAVVLGCGGCTAVTPGAPDPAPGSATPGPLVPATRPVELRLDGVDPCAILSAEQHAELGLDDSAVPHTDDFALFGAYQACSLSGFEPRAVSVDLAVVTERGIEAITSGPVTDDLMKITVGGFPAVLARPANQVFCAVDVDVAQGQFLDVHFRDGGGRKTIPQDQLCRDAQAVAEAAVASLRAR